MAQQVTWWDVSHWLEREAGLIDQDGTEQASTPPAPTREAAPAPPQGPEISDEEILEVFNRGFADSLGLNGFLVHARENAEGSAYASGLRAVWARAQARPAITEEGRDDG